MMMGGRVPFRDYPSDVVEVYASLHRQFEGRGAE